jgi:hypothetical protein
MLRIEKMPSIATQYVKKPIIVRAIQVLEYFEVVTLEGNVIGKPGDYLIEGNRGELYLCDKEIFLESYEEAK